MLKKKSYFESNIVPFPYLKETLQEIKQKKILNIILTDNEKGSKFIREKILTKLDVNDVVDKIYSSVEIGFSKPDKRIYQYALTKNNISEESCFFVGHEKEEIDGAKYCNIKTIAYNYNQDVESDYYINNLNKIINII